jgi:hypothetical protein
MNLNDILYSTWGYDQTNVDFYKVIKVSGKFVTVKQLKADKQPSGDMSYNATPTDEFADEAPLRRMVKDATWSDGHTYIKLESYSTAALWNGSPISGNTWG